MQPGYIARLFSGVWGALMLSFATHNNIKLEAPAARHGSFYPRPSRGRGNAAVKRMARKRRNVLRNRRAHRG